MNHITILSTLVLLSQSTSAQTDLIADMSTLGAQPLDLVQQVGMPGNGFWALTAVGASHRRWERITGIGPDGASPQTQTNSFTELASGMNVWSESEKKWSPATAEIELFNGAAVARNAQHRVIFSANLNDPDGTIDLLTPAGKRLRSRITGLAYTDATGKSVFVAETIDSQGLLIDDQQVMYQHAFDLVKADVRYTMTVSSFEQDVILRTQLPDPAEYGLDPNTTRVELWTEFLQAPEPKQTSQLIRTVQGELQSDQQLEFDSFTMVLGKAYAIGDGAVDGHSARMPIAKEWHNIEGRQFLVEGTDYATLQPLMKNLDRHQADANRRIVTPSLLAHATGLSGRSVPLRSQIKSNEGSSKKLTIAKATPSLGPGLVLDYLIVNATYTNFTFRGDSTYYVSGPVNMIQNTVLEGGAVIKMTNYISGVNFYPGIYIYGPFTCKTAPYREAVFTAKDDDSVGETIPGSTGTPSGMYGLTSLYFANNISSNVVEYACFRSAANGLFFNNGNGHQVRHCQIVNCYVGIQPNSCNLAIRNSLVAGSGFTALDVYGSTVSGENLTISGCNRIFNNNSSSLALTNSLLVAFAGSDSFTSVSNATNSSAVGVFQPVGAGNFYLAPGSPYRNVGTTGINAQLSADLRSMTTYPPIILTNSFTMSTTLSPQAPRDTDAIDLGFHYLPIDFCLCNLTIANMTLTLTNGVVLGYYSPATALSLKDGGKLVSQGTPGTLNWLVPALAVQEQGRTDWLPWGAVIREDETALNVAKELTLKFTGVTGLGSGTYQVWIGAKMTNVVIRDCQFYGGGFWLDTATSAGWPMRVENSLFDRMVVRLLPGANSPAVNLHNNLVRMTWVSLSAPATNAWSITDNLFESLLDLVQSGTITNQNNAYYFTGSLASSRGGDITLANVPDYLTTAFGRFYYPTAGGNLSQLINAGSRTAGAAGLYHYTTSTAPTEEANSTVDIGFHYVALNSSVYPNDADNDGLPDYFEDRNGNGTVDNGETDWQSSNSAVAGAAALQVFTPLR